MTAPNPLDAFAARILELSEKATPGDWQVRFMHRVFDSARKDPVNLFGTAPEQDWPDCELICELRNHATTLAAIAKAAAECERALGAIADWEMPPTGKFWENTDGSMSDRPMTYGACYGSNGERDVIKARARSALAAIAAVKKEMET